MLAQTRQVKEGIGATLALLLTLPSLGNQRRRGRRVVAGLPDRIKGSDFPGDRQVQVDTIQQRPREFVAIALNLLRRAAAARAGIAQVAGSVPATCMGMDML